MGFYRAPNNSNVGEFCNLLDDRILSQFSPSQLVAVGGDANIDLLNDDRMNGRYIDLFQSFSFIPYITMPTRVTHNSCTLIDHLWCNVVSNAKAGIIRTDITDHYTIFLCLFDRKSDNSLVRREFRDFSGDCLADLKVKLADAFSDFSVYDSLDIILKTEVFHEIFWKTFNVCVL